MAATPRAFPVAVSSRRVPWTASPEQAFVTLYGEATDAFWLDSSLRGSDSTRWTFMGSAAGPLGRVLRYDSVQGELHITDAAGTRTRTVGMLDHLSAELERLHCVSPDLPFDFNCGLVGWFGYEMKSDCGGGQRHRAHTPDAAFLLADRLLAFDHDERCVYLVCLTDGTAAANQRAAEAWFEETSELLAKLPPAAPAADSIQSPEVVFRLRTPYRQYLDGVGRCLELIRDGETYEVCLTNRIDVEAEFDPLALYRHLRRVNPAPYSAYLRVGESRVLCSSPERFLRVLPDGVVESKPIKGTLPRGRTPTEDARLREQLRGSEKDRAENLMIVDLMRNDLGRVCEVGSVHVPVLMDVESYETVHQMVSTIRGRLRADADAIACVRASFPGGSMTGAPKLRTMEIIDDLEPCARGVYSGSAGFLALSGAADLNIVIRTIVAHGDSLSIGVGGAIVALSDPEREFEETLVKARALIGAVVECAGFDFTADDYARVRAELRESGSVRFTRA